MDWEDSGGSGSDDETDHIWSLHKVKNLTNSSNTRASMKGLQLALHEGWIIQRAREMCSWTHDRYRQAAQEEADSLPSTTISKMSLRGFVDIQGKISSPVVIGEYSTSNTILDECEGHTQSPEDIANTLRLRSRNYFFCNNFAEALAQVLRALKQLGVEINPAPSEQDVDSMFDRVKHEILAVGFDEILKMPRATDKRTELAIALLNDAGSSFPSNGKIF
ncbi:hypothetical protein C0991_006843 [Blastosporella zonata]|nr:hypothetical protein C0991_006843 [Blastosporella zonata]